jgi:hypothetical protein
MSVIIGIMPPLVMYKMKDPGDKYVKDKGQLWNLPLRLALVGRTGAGKTSQLGNLMLRSDMYRGDWDGPDIYVFSGSLAGDHKLRTIIDELEIPSSNLIQGYDDATLHVIYELIMKRFNEAKEKGETPVHSLIIIDDCSFGGALARNGAKNDALQRVCQNGRKYLVSVLVTSQKYSSIATAVRENLSGCMIGQSTGKQLDLIIGDWNYLHDKNKFRELFNQQTKDAHDYFIADLEDPAVYLDHTFLPLPHLLEQKR